MKMHYLNSPATELQIKEMTEALETRIKFAVDIERHVAVGGGEFHADCEQELLRRGSSQADIWGADFVVGSRQFVFDALINLSPVRQNPSMLIIDPKVRRRVELILRELLPQDE